MLWSVISHRGIIFPADQVLFPKHDLDGSFHNAAFLKSSPEMTKPEITKHSATTSSDLILAARGVVLAEDVA